ncbi:uncharacterized protein LOC105701780 isoform X2 [Orussus abietinus]|uniref:uncharacterized protein LOC105701780 isoform X2 n=1 Tax=Orussus abietinus TaxID=222816 RepID=UPI0006263EA4|nr:uncharacterized protein LOC105701780 isoform X2 [Orussus abietinus]
MSVLNQSGEDAVECPLCMEPLEVDDLNFFPCTCGYQICRFCWHRIRTDENGLCPACRKAYSENPADFKPLTKEEISRLKNEKKLKDQQRKQRVTENRKHLANVRVVQKNLVFVVGLPMRLADADVLKRHEYFGKFGKIHKVVINQSTSYAGSQGPSASAYVTYQRQEDALRAIEAVNNIVVDGRTIKTSLGTTKYCSHFMRNQACPKPDCMYLHDHGDKEASFTKEEMHQGKHQEYERKLVQSLHAHASSLQRKPTPSPPVTGGGVRENGTANTQPKEAWPSLQPGQTNSTAANCKESSPPPAAQVGSVGQNNSENGGNAAVQSNHAAAGQGHQHSNNNKGENGTGLRRGKSNSESKAQAARNKHKNSQNKEKHGGTRMSSRSESSAIPLGGNNLAAVQNGAQEDIRNFGLAETTVSGGEVSQKPGLNSRCKSDSQQIQQQAHQQTAGQGKGTRTTAGGHHQVQHELKVNGVLRHERSPSESESEAQREGSTPASTISSSEDSNANHNGERLGESVALDENGSTAVLGTSPASTNSSQGGRSQHPPPGLLHTANGTSTGSQMQLNHRSIFQADNNSFFSSNSFQKISAVVSMPPSSQTANVSLDWTSTSLASIPDSPPTVHSSEDWQAAFGFQPESSRSNHEVHRTSPASSPGMPFNGEDFVNEEVYANSRYTTLTSDSAVSFVSSLPANSPASKFMADFQQNSLQQRLAMQECVYNVLKVQNQENCEFIKQNGHATLEEMHKHHEAESEVKADDDLGFDPFHETQKALAELMENEMQLQQQRVYQQQQQQRQQQREREERNRVQQPGLGELGSQHFPQNLVAAPSGTQSPAQGSVTAANLGQRSRLPPPGFPGSAANHMNSFGLGIPRPAPTNSALSGSKILPFVSHTSGVLFTGAQTPQQTQYLPNGNPLLNSQGVGKCAGDTVYSLKDWCELTNQHQQHQHQQQQFHHQSLHQKGGWNNFGPIADWTSIDPAIVSSSRPLQFQATGTWQLPHAYPAHSASHGSQQEQNVPAQHWAMQPPPGFSAPASSAQLGTQPPNVTAQPHTKLISAGSEIENV